MWDPASLGLSRRAGPRVSGLLHSADFLESGTKAWRGHLWLAVRSSALSSTGELKAAGSAGTRTPPPQAHLPTLLPGQPLSGPALKAQGWGLGSRPHSQISDGDLIHLPSGHVHWNICSQGPQGMLAPCLVTPETLDRSPPALLPAPR